MMADPASLRSGSSRDLPYRVAWRARGVHAGAHRGRSSGAGGLFRDLATLLEAPDPRRLDLRASVRDPFEQLYVRRFEKSTAITLYALVDVSASMGFVGNMRKLEVAAAICAALALSARRIGDSFGVIGCDREIVPELHFPATRSRAGAAAAALSAFRPKRRGAGGLIDAAARIAGRRKLVLLISDFQIEADELSAVFEACAAHDTVPVQLIDSAELVSLPRWGLLPLADLETGQRRLVLLRPSLKAAWERARAEHDARLEALAARYARAPLRIVDRLDWERLAAHLMEARG
ncbi:DUF58 domain-containing protein [Rhodopseudomonas palustris]|uniref:DUF58 domain-containing protein n=1 Tax=Rhodopseudomonas palustris (strain BisB18) TaxID=316056 RepID=Q217G7_RHOPB